MEGGSIERNGIVYHENVLAPLRRGELAVLADYIQPDGSHVYCVHFIEPVFGSFDCGVDEAVEMLVPIYKAIFQAMEATGCTKLRLPPLA